MLNSLKICLQYILPKIWITRLFGWIANIKAGWLTKLVIDLFVKYYKIDMHEAQKVNTANYHTFNDFFVRALRDEVRPINEDPNTLVMPVDGTINQLGKIENDQLIQAKGHNYNLESLLAGNYLIADLFRDGLFIVIYISPKDSHRVYMPCDGVLREMIYVPGDLFSVNLSTSQSIPNIFARNERVICLFDTKFGPMVQILVGAMVVGSIETVWSGIITPPREGVFKRWTWPTNENDHSINLIKGQEIGRFRLGSTVINLFVKQKVTFVTQLTKSSIVKFGQSMAIHDENNSIKIS